MTITQYVRVHGVVQGVGYRMSMVREAERLQVTGWVRNCADGSVEAVLQGPRPAVETLIEWSKRGPSGARVERVEIGDGEGVFPDFAMLPTK